jgi:hypothetical protein
MGGRQGIGKEGQEPLCCIHGGVDAKLAKVLIQLGTALGEEGLELVKVKMKTFHVEHV